MPIKKNINKDFFKTWTPEMAYVLGFFFADGSHDINPRGSEYFSFQITDKELLKEIAQVMNSNHKIAVRLRKKSTEKTQYRLQIGSKEMCGDLRKLGVLQQKAYTAKLPDVPKKYLGNFIRGYFDGDGNVWSGMIHKNRKKQMTTLLVAFTSCSQYFLTELQIILHANGIGQGSLFVRSGAYRLQYSAKDSIILFNLMYGSSMFNRLVLERKKIVFEQYLEQRKTAAVSKSLHTLHSKRVQK